MGNKITVKSLDIFVSLCAAFTKEGLTFEAHGERVDSRFFDDGDNEFTITLTGGY